MSLSIRDVLLLPRLQAMRLRAGQAGEHQTVRWPYVAENESIAEWVLGGELVFVTGINQPRDEANVLQLAGTAALFRSFAPEMAETLLQSFRQEVLSQLSRSLATLGQPLPVISQAEQWIALLPAGEADALARHRASVEQLLHTLNEGDTPLRVFAGLSATCPQPTELPRGLGQARQALMAAQSFPEIG